MARLTDEEVRDIRETALDGFCYSLHMTAGPIGYLKRCVIWLLADRVVLVEVKDELAALAVQRRKDCSAAKTVQADAEPQAQLLREALGWIAYQPCTMDAEGSASDCPCTETSACLTEYCLPCYARAAARRGETAAWEASYTLATREAK